MTATATATLALSPQLEALIREKIASGRYRDPAEVIGEALRLLDERDRRLDWLRAEVAVGLEQIERGEEAEFTPELVERLRREADENARLGKPVKDAVKP